MGSWPSRRPASTSRLLDDAHAAVGIGQGAHRLEQRGQTRVAVAVDGVTEAGQPPARRQHAIDGLVRAPCRHRVVEQFGSRACSPCRAAGRRRRTDRRRSRRTGRHAPSTPPARRACSSPVRGRRAAPARVTSRRPTRAKDAAGRPLPCRVASRPSAARRAGWVRAPAIGEPRSVRRRRRRWPRTSSPPTSASRSGRRRRPRQARARHRSSAIRSTGHGTSACRACPVHSNSATCSNVCVRGELGGIVSAVATRLRPGAP